MRMEDYLFTWWTMSISFSIIFITLISIYLYVSSRPKRKDDIPKKTSALKLGKDFVFVLVLVSLLAFYIFSIQLARTNATDLLSETVFAAGNVAVEALLIIYLLMNRKSEPTQA
jgi:hypothetical protein